MSKRSVGMVLAALVATLLSATPASAADATNVVHGIPGVDVDVCVNGAEAISGFNPGEVVTGVSLPAGSYDVKIVGTGTTAMTPRSCRRPISSSHRGRASRRSRT